MTQHPDRPGRPHRRSRPGRGDRRHRSRPSASSSRRATADLSTLLRKEVELAKLEVSGAAKKAGIGAGAFGGAGFLGFLALIFCSIAAAEGHRHGAPAVGGLPHRRPGSTCCSPPSWPCSASRSSARSARPKRTIDTTKDTVAWAKHPTQKPRDARPRETAQPPPDRRPRSRPPRCPAPGSHREVSAGGIRFHVAEAGEGPLVLLLHGFPQNWWVWRHQLPALAEAGFHAVAPDLRGYGGTDKPPRGYDLPTLAADMAGLVRALGHTEAVVVGSRLGRRDRLDMAAVHPEVVRSLVVTGIAHPRLMRAALLRDPAQRRASAYMLPFQLPRLRRAQGDSPRRPARRRTCCGPGAARTGPATADFAEAERRYRDAGRLPHVAHSALEYYRWAVRSAAAQPTAGATHRALRAPGRGAGAAAARRARPLHPAGDRRRAERVRARGPGVAPAPRGRALRAGGGAGGAHRHCCPALDASA